MDEDWLTSWKTRPACSCGQQFSCDVVCSTAEGMQDYCVRKICTKCDVCPRCEQYACQICRRLQCQKCFELRCCEPYISHCHFE